MSFLDPLFLIGLLAAALPIVVHLFNKRKAVTRPFPAMRLLMESNKRTARSMKVRQWSLLAMRMLAVALLAMALAKPFCLSERGISGDARMPTAVVFVVDTSASMAHGKWWSTAQDHFNDELSNLKPWDEVSLIDTAQPDMALVRLTNERDKVKSAFKKLKPTQAHHDIGRALELSRELLATSQLPARRVVVISDLAKNSVSTSGKKELNAPLTLKSVRAKKAKTPQNLAITSVKYAQEGSAQEHLWRIDTQIKNYGLNASKSQEMQLSIDSNVIASSKVPAIKPGEVITHTIRHTHKGTGVVRASMTLPKADDYAPDNRYDFAFRTRDRVRALLVNGESSSLSYDDETFFLSRALNPKRSKDRGIVPRVVNIKALSSVKLDEYDVLFLCNVPRIGADVAQKIQTYVTQGGGVFITLGDQIDINAYNQTLGAIMPKQLRGLKKLADIDDPDAPVKITRLGATTHTHPIFRAFSLPGGDTLHAVQVYSYMLMEPGVVTNSQTIMSFKDNAPALIARNVGQGRVLLWTTSIDNEWTDFPVRPTYLPLLHRAVEYLARRASSDANVKNEVGKTIALELQDATQKRVIIKGPMHEKSPDRTVLAPTDGKVLFTPKRQGFYRVWVDSIDAKDPLKNQRTGLAFSVQVAHKESDLATISPDAFGSWQSAKSAKNTKGKNSATVQKRINWWPKILFLITILFLLETIIGTRRSVLEKIWRKLTNQPLEAIEDQNT